MGNIKQQHLHTTVAILLSIIFFPLLAHAGQIQKPTYSQSYNQLFVSYFAPENVVATVHYIKNPQLGGVSIADIRSDYAYPLAKQVSANDTDQDNLFPSLLWNIWKAYTDAPTVDYSTIKVMAYYPNWAVYPTAIPGKFYPLSPNNNDFNDKLHGLNTVIYADLETQTSSVTINNQTIPNPFPKEIGQLYFNDPWSDFSVAKINSLCKAIDANYNTVYNNICWFVNNIKDGAKPGPNNLTDFAHYGNFENFATLSRADNFFPYGRLYRIAAIGGYRHDATFEEMFNQSTYITNFINSAQTILNIFQNSQNRGLDGFDLEYINPNMTQDQSIAYADIVRQLNAKLNPTGTATKDRKLIIVTILANPAYLNPHDPKDKGFAKAALKTITDNADYINLLTYDFHGAFNYADDGSGKTGLISNLFPAMPQPDLSIKQSIDALQTALDHDSSLNKKIIISIPTFGRAVQGIAPGDNDGLFQTITAEPIPQGDLDSLSCNQNIANKDDPNICSGTFQYRYIVDNMLKSNNFTSTIWQKIEACEVDGASTYNAGVWTPTPYNTLTINTSADDNTPNSLTDITIQNSGQDPNISFTTQIKPNQQNIYDPFANSSTFSINNEKNLVVKYSKGGKEGVCPGYLDFSKNATLTFTFNNGQVACAIGN